MKKAVIYTSLTGGYDALPIYDYYDSNFDYICFSNDFEEGCIINGWLIKPIPFESKNLIELSRFVKLNPHLALSEYEYSIWIDTNIRITNDRPYERFKELINTNTLMACVIHPELDCIYEDIKLCVKKGKVKYHEAKDHVIFLLNEKYPTNNGLFENNLIFRKHNDLTIKMISEKWWSLFENLTKRDQFSLCYIFWKMNFKPSLIFPQGISTKNANGFVRYNHSKWKFSKRIRHFIFRKYQTILLFLSPII